MSENTWKFSSAKLSKVEELTDSGFEQGHTIAWYGSASFGTGNTAANIKKSWESRRGAFLFLKAAWDEINTNDFTTKLNTYLKGPIRRNISFLWLENPLDPIRRWKTNSISTELDEVCQLTYLDFRNYSCSIARLTEINLVGTTFEFKQKAANPRTFEFSTAYGRHRFYQVGMIRPDPDDVTKEIRVIQLPMKGEQAACLKFNFKINKEGSASTTFGYPGLPQLDIGMRIFFRDPEFPESGDDFYLGSHRYPFLQESSTYDEAHPFFPASLDWQVSLDLLYPHHSKRSYFEFIPPGAPNLESGLPSAYRTNAGYTVHLLPKAGESRLLFADRPATLKAEDQEDAPLYLIPSGKFGIKIPRYTSDTPRVFVSEANIICGISGLEYVKVGAGFEINFVARQAGYAGAFLSFNALIRDFNLIQKKFQRSVWVNPKDPDTPPSGGKPIDLPQTFDLDMEVEATDGLNISDEGRLAMLDEVLLDYFPGDFHVSKSQREAYVAIAIVEDWIQWFRDTMKEATLLIARGSGLLNKEVTTSWAYITGNPNAIYFAQPDNAALHMAEQTSKEFLDFMEVPAMGLPNSISNPTKLKELTGSEIPAYPMMPYGNIDPASVSDLRQMELLVLNPVRRQLIHQIGASESFSTALTTDTSGNRIGTTPQGLIAEFSDDWETIDELQLAKDTKGKQVSFVDIQHGSAMKSALQSNQLFLVISDPAAVMDYFSDAKLRSVTKARLEGEINKSSLNASQKTTLRNALNTVFENFDTLEISLASKLKETLSNLISDAGKRNALETAFEEVLKHSLENDLDLMDWVFELGPDYWDRNGTIMVFKYTNTSLLEMASQPDNWFMPETFNQDKETTSSDLLQLLSEAIELGTGLDPKAKKKYESLAIAASQPNWTGILLLNVHVPLRGLPDSLKALAGGMNPDLFYAQYLGVEVTQVKTSGSGAQIALNPQESSIFALIDYDNPEVPRAEPSGYNFHVPSLSIVFKNSHIVHFAAEVFLIIEKLFDERARLLNSNRNIISLRGVAEEHNGRITYAFGFSGANRFLMSRKVLEEVEIIKAQFATDPLPPKEERPVELKIVGRFTLWGGIRFAYLRDFDILSFGRSPNDVPKNGKTPADDNRPPDFLSISNLEITLTFSLNTKTNEVGQAKDASGAVIPKFHFIPSNVTVDIVQSGWRKQSLFEQFPLTFRGFSNVKTPSGQDVKTGYMPVSAPARRAKLGENYYAMKFDLKLGNLGALAGSKPLVAGFLVAWNPGKEGVLVGLKLPGSSGDKKEIVLQGLLKLTFRTIRFVVFDKKDIPSNESEEARKERESKEREVGYLLNLKNIKLNFFVLSFPPIGQTEMTLFGDPRDGDEIKRADRLIGWYAAYVKN